MAIRFRGLCFASSMTKVRRCSYPIYVYDRRGLPSRGHRTRGDRPEIGRMRLARAEPAGDERRRGCGRCGARVPDRGRAGRLRALRRAATVRRRRSQGRRNDALGLFGPSRALHGRRARLSGSGGGTGSLRICRFAGRNPVPRPRRPRSRLSPRLRLPSSGDAGAPAQGARNAAAAAHVDAAAHRGRIARVPGRGGRRRRALAGAEPSPRTDPNGDRRGQDLHRRDALLSAAGPRRLSPHPVPRRPRQPRAPDA